MMGYNDAGRLRMIRWCRRQGLPCFLFGDSNIHGDLVTGIKARLKKIVVNWVVRSCSGILACGSLGKAYFIKYGARADRIFYFPYEPDYELIENLPDERLALVRDRFKLDPARRRLVYSGRLIGVKRVDLLMDAFIAIALRRPEWDLVIIGDGSMKLELLAKIPADLLSRVIWAGFVDDQSVVSAVYRLSDVLVLPSDYEPWALVINEAVAAGLAIVCSSVVGAAAELLRDRINGRSFTAGDLSALTAAMLEVTDIQTLERMKAASPMVLADWRKRGDPVEGLRQAMRTVPVFEVDKQKGL
jgi:glycosyltransferase involved in cell wall biosynthesis